MFCAVQSCIFWFIIAWILYLCVPGGLCIALAVWFRWDFSSSVWWTNLSNCKTLGKWLYIYIRFPSAYVFAVCVYFIHLDYEIRRHHSLFLCPHFRCCTCLYETLFTCCTCSHGKLIFIEAFSTFKKYTCFYILFLLVTFDSKRYSIVVFNPVLFNTIQ